MKTVTVDIDLGEFDDRDILAVALSILRRSSMRPGGWGVNGEAIEALRSHFRAEFLEETLPPPSTAARIRSLAELRALVSPTPTDGEVK